MSQPLRCLIVDDDPLVREQFSSFVGAHDALELAGSCESAVQAANFLARDPVDLVFLDVEMPLMTGLELVESLDQRPQVVLVTGKTDYAVDAFDIEVTDFLLKPVSYARFLKAVKRAERLAAPVAGSSGTDDNAESDHVFFKTGGRLVKLHLREVRYVEAQGDYVMVHTDSDNHLILGRLKGIAEKLPDRHFVRVHRSYIVRIDRIEDIEDNSLVIGRAVIPIGGSYKARLLERLKTL